MTPVEISRLDDGRTLAIAWEGGEVAQLSAAFAPANSRAASMAPAFADNRPPYWDEGVRLTDIELVGADPIRLSFSDGHGFQAPLEDPAGPHINLG